MGVHYAKRWPSISHAFGLFHGEMMIGCVTFGTPPSAPLRRGVAGDQHKDRVIELNRLVLSENVKNYASFLVSKALKMLGVDAIVVSFADTAQGHNGAIYRACNFSYCGLSAKRTDWKIRGREHLHGQTIADEFRGRPNRAALMREKYGDDFYLAPRSMKHRYLYVVGSRNFKKTVAASLLWLPQTFVKSQTGERQDDGSETNQAMVRQGRAQAGLGGPADPSGILQLQPLDDGTHRAVRSLPPPHRRHHGD
jgi:hypothetical protein